MCENLKNENENLNKKIEKMGLEKEKLEIQIEKSELSIQKIQLDNDRIKDEKKTQEKEYKDIDKTLKQLKKEHTKKDELIQQLQREKDDLNYSIDGLNSSISSMKIKHDEAIQELSSKYNECVDLIHSLITTTSLIKNEISNMGFTKRTLHYKKNINSIYKEKNMDILINQQLIQEECAIPEKRIDKQ